MATNVRIELELPDDSVTDMQNMIERGDKRASLAGIQNLLNSIQGGARPAVLHAQVCGVIASQTVTCDQSAAVDGTDDITIAAGATTATISVEASPSGENQMDAGTTDAEFADNLAAAINAHSDLQDFVRAVSDGASVVTVFALTAGVVGHGITLAETGSGFALGAAALAGGTSVAPKEYGFGYV